MHFLQRERLTLAKFLPTLDDRLQAKSMLELEAKGSPALQIFRELGGPGLLIPREYGGSGVTPLELTQIQRAIATRSPSLAIAANMHHCTVAALLESIADESVAEFIRAIAENNLYLASGFAEGKTGVSILLPTMKCQRVADGLLVSGSKKPCSLSASMDFLTASAIVPGKSGEGDQLALVIIAADSPGIERKPFWNTWVLKGAESEEVILNDVLVPEEFVYYLGKPEDLGNILAKAFIWVELFLSASYLGAASALVERVIAERKGTPSERTSVAIEVEGAMAALETVANSIMVGGNSDAEVAQSLFVRYSVQRAIERVTETSVELLGGIAFIRSEEIAYLLAAARALAFHPPSRLSMASYLDDYLAGGPLLMP
ncbi:acyl-CoA/acyl-ACP dehydrogenase [Sphaerospermopsis aphanizomenoides BCCUSP55]|uniref:acyl-CoA dehydrogenase family protein n=1 Tax=Sphaerospermopsis aphanizomenoides TaxID=459663 RepID=UPI000A97FD50|nr:acyl-CoA dehydrogenase family protein [Sphaerospermopsis aphanizomenoides]MBK1987678.1 acyl-CoA/acyl-ACP dehydrogenase [Sphaerospermopsis aphanizomenoides BCCUSP55]